MAGDWRSEKTPVFISLPENPEVAAKIQTAFDGTVAGFVNKPFDGVDMKGKIDLALEGADLPSSNREDAELVSLNAAKALAAVDAVRTQFPIGQATDALIGTLDARADMIRIAALDALGNAAQNPATGEVAKGRIASVTDVYQAQDGQLQPDVRAAFLRAIGHLDPTTDASVEIIEVALQSGDEEVSAAAHAAVGHANALSNVLLRDLQVQQRLNIRAVGAGQPQ